jgi:hypothetical protein
MVLEGPEDTWEVVRTIVGATNPRKAAPGTIRGDLGILFTENLVHGSDSLEAAQRGSAFSSRICNNPALRYTGRNCAEPARQVRARSVRRCGGSDGQEQPTRDRS